MLVVYIYLVRLHAMGHAGVYTLRGLATPPLGSGAQAPWSVRNIGRRDLREQAWMRQIRLVMLRLLLLRRVSALCLPLHRRWQSAHSVFNDTVSRALDSHVLVHLATCSLANPPTLP